MSGDSLPPDATDERARYERLHRLFDAARNLTPDARADFAAESCAGDEELRAELEKLMAAMGDADAPFSDASLDRGREQLERLFDTPDEIDAMPATDAGWLPETIGAYRVIDRIGAGGMGVVYEAEQSSPRRRVALKLIHPGHLTTERVQRFEREARILARLSHPGIAQVYEAGSFDAGRGSQPFFAMELVDGVDLRSYVRREGLDDRARIELIAAVCDAVHHAHRAGIVHRDLKPDNVLVDASGRPKVLDFGIAFTTESSTLLSTLVTEEGRILGTLAYMAPEQLQGSQAEITPRTDVYALGAMAFELLAGELPVDPTGLSITAGIQLVASAEPKRAGAVRRVLRGDLDTILGKALEKEPPRRYESAEALAADLRRHLADQPIAARPPSTAYRVHKFARRHKGVVAALVALALGVVTSTALAILADERRREADALGAELDTSLYLAQMQLASDVAFEPSSAPRIRETIAPWNPRDGAADRRGFEWYMLDRLTRADETVLDRGERLTALRWHPSRDLFVTGERDAAVYDGDVGAFVANLGNAFDVHEIAWSPSGDVVALTGPFEVAIYETDTWEQIALYTTNTEGLGLAWHPSGAHLLVTGRDGTVRRLDRGTWELELVHEDRYLYGHEGLCSFHPSGAYLVVTTDRANAAQAFDATTFEAGPILPFAADISINITRIQFSPSGDRIAVAGSRGTVEIFATGEPDDADWKLLQLLEGHDQRVVDVMWSADGSRLATSSADRSVQVFDTATGRRLELKRGHAASVDAIDWRPSDGVLASASLDGTVRLWESTSTPAQWFVPGREGAWTSEAAIAFGPDDDWIAVDTGLGTELRAIVGGRVSPAREIHSGSFVEWRDDGRYLAWYSGEHLVVYDWEHDREHARRWVGAATAYGAHIAWNPWRPEVIALGGAIHLRLVEVPDEVGAEPVERKLPLEAGIVRDVDWIRGGAQLLVASTNGATGSTSIVHLDDGDRIEPGPSLGNVDPLDVDVSPDGRHAAFALDNGTVRVLAIEDWSEVHVLAGHTNRVRCVAYSPDGARLATGSGDRSLRLWDARSGRLAATFTFDTGVRNLAWSHDGGQLVVMGDDTSIRLFDARPKAAGAVRGR
ncbi:Serine/threonine-protein kinase PrkC [Planctomycetes bacterium Pla163]|uniref:Serine/threonine-protein kinase PrkC n=1 Tax=Rohdeia mirabilis TaxID=2528008 RepID=A0A518CW11_9BACT|nr:Serine/threonine-protein kinase PrkC [Planctomycetes bacterium Pla163]